MNTFQWGSGWGLLIEAYSRACNMKIARYGARVSKRKKKNRGEVGDSRETKVLVKASRAYSPIFEYEPHLTPASMPSITWAKFNELLTVFSLVYPEEGSIAETSVKILIITATVLHFLILLENHTLYSGTYLYSPYMAVPLTPPGPSLWWKGSGNAEHILELNVRRRRDFI